MTIFKVRNRFQSTYSFNFKILLMAMAMSLNTYMKFQPYLESDWVLFGVRKKNKYLKTKNKSVKKIDFRENIWKKIISFICIVFQLWHFFFVVKFHINDYFSENVRYFQKPLILQAIQWYSKLTARCQIWFYLINGKLVNSDFSPLKV